MELIVVVSQYEAVARIIQALDVAVDEEHKHHLADWRGAGPELRRRPQPGTGPGLITQPSDLAATIAVKDVRI